MLIAKLILVPLLVLSVSLVGRRWGPSAAGVLAGLPLVAGPLLLFLALEHGRAFASEVASASLGALLAPLAFNVVYARASRRRSWPESLARGLSAWCLTGSATLHLPTCTTWRLAVAVPCLLIAPALFPRPAATARALTSGGRELLARATASGVVVLLVASAAEHAGASYSGLFTVSPTLGTVLGVSMHRGAGAASCAALLKTMSEGCASLAVFLTMLAVLLPRVELAPAFVLAILAALATAGSSN